MAQQSPTYPTVSAELTDYWNRRPDLSKPEWARFYMLVRAALMSASAPQLASLPEDREVYIAEFFQDKVFYTTPISEHELLEGALRKFFRNYLTDKIRAKPDTIQTSTFDDDGDAFVDRIPHEIDSEEAEVREFLNIIPVEKLAQSAIAFIDSLEERHRLMLSGHYCADSPVPMSTLFRGVNGYHYQAQRLGVTVNRGSRGLEGYEHTLIGQWMCSLGVKPAPENLALVHFLLKTLCFHTY
jgi:hypothetical protein